MPADAPSTRTADERRRLYGQNFFRSASDADRFTRQVKITHPYVVFVEIGPGSGRITASLARLGRPVIAVEIDPHWSGLLAAQNLPGVTAVTADFLHWQPPAGPIHAVGNLPFGAGTKILRRCLEFGPSTLVAATLLLQAEYVGKRTGRWGENLFNMQWRPWYEFDSGLAFPRHAFSPVPRADTATLLVRAAGEPALPWRDRIAYQRFVASVYETGHAAIDEAARAALGQAGSRSVRRAGIAPTQAVKQLTCEQWVSLFRHAAPQHTQESRDTRAGRGGQRVPRRTGAPAARRHRPGSGRARP